MKKWGVCPYSQVPCIKVQAFRMVLLVQSCGHIDASLLSTASQTLSGHVRRSGEHVE